jgi:hypothetical protein
MFPGAKYIRTQVEEEKRKHGREISSLVHTVVALELLAKPWKPQVLSWETPNFFIFLLQI